MQVISLENLLFEKFNCMAKAEGARSLNSIIHTFVTVVHYREIKMGVVVFAKVQGLLKFESPRTKRVRGL